MPWTHDNGVIICESAKHSRHVRIYLRSQGAVHKCYNCWRRCEFRRIGGLVEHVFKAERPLPPQENTYSDSYWEV